MERIIPKGQRQVLEKMKTVGFGEDEGNRLLGVGGISSPQDVPYVTRRELLGLGFNKKDVRRIERTFSSE